MPTGVTVQKTKVRGELRWCVHRKENGKRKRSFHTSKAKADAEAVTLRTQQDRAGTVWISLPAAERQRLIEVYAEARKLGVELSDLLHRWKLSPQSHQATATVGDTIKELVAVKLKSGLSQDYVTVLRFVLEKFARGREAMAISQISLANVELYLDAHSLDYRKTLRSRISTLFRFAIRRGYRTDNPCSRLELVKVTKKPPAILTPAQTGTCLEWLLKNPRGLAWFVLTDIVGMRPEEAQKTSWHEINFTERLVKIEAQTTKVRQRRVVYLTPTAVRLLQVAKKLGADLPLDKYGKRWIQTRLRDLLGFKKWPKDITRHSAASYWLADSGDVVKVASMLGHSVDTLNRDYKALVTRKQVRELARVIKAKLGNL